MRNHSIFKLYLGLLLTFILSVPALAQTTYTGTVVDENNEPVIGASIKVVGTTTGTITDFDGKFTLTVPDKGSIEVSFIGYITQKISDFKNTKIVLKEDTQNLEEVVVVGYMSQKKAHLTGSVATVPMDDIQDLSSGGLAAMLDGLVNGLSVSGGDARPGENARLYIRDTNSLGDVGSTAQQPLFVIDGFIYPNDVKVGNVTQNLGAEAFNNLDPSVVESISVLKDASAAVYGARAANGVILVTTKKGKLGAPTISYNGTFGFTDEVDRPKMLSAYDYGRMYNAVKAADPYNTSLNLTTGLFQADELNAMKGLNYDLLDKYWETAITMKHAINISGATEKANYFASVSYFDQDGNLGRLDYDRWNYRAGVDVKVSKWLKANLTVSGDYGKHNKPLVKVGGSSGEKDYNLLLTRPQYIPEYVNGLPIAAAGPANTISNDQNYHFALLQDNGDYSKTMNQNTTINGSLAYDFGWSKLLKGLNLRFNYSKSINTSKNNEYATDFTIYKMLQRSGSGSHLYTPVDGTDYDALMAESNLVGSTISNGDISYLSRNMVRTDSYQMNFTASYDRDFAEHHVSALFSIEKSETESEYVYARQTEPYAFTTGQWNSTAGEASKNNSQFTRSESGTLSYIGRINYSYASKYLFEFLLRSDASTKFAPKNYWGTFPSASAGWIISEENWFNKEKLGINFLKIRASLGLTGRDNTAPWQWMRIYSQDAYRGPIFGTSSDGSSLNRITFNKNNSAVNSDVHWDKSYKANLGIDMNVLDNRLAITFDAYREWNREMLMNISQAVPSTVGTQSAAVNLGEMDNWGYELGLTWKDKIGKDFKYRIGLNTGYSDNKVLNMDWTTNYLYRQITQGHRSDVGTWGMQCIGMFRSFQDIEEYFDAHMKKADGTYGTYMGKTKDQIRPGMLIYKDIRGEQQADGTYAAPNGIISQDEDQVRLSDRSNPYGFTVNLGADWKGFSLTAQVRASWGGYSFIPSSAIKQSSIESANMPSFWNPDNMFVYQDIYDGSGNLVMKQNREASMPNLAYSDVNSVQSSFWRISGTRVSFTRLTLAYSIPANLIKGIGLQSCRFNITGQNLLSLYNPYPDNFMDPMTSYGSYPALRKFTVGVNLTF
jgi:TonB-linked SusC/RagA family outer membrane protein